MKAFVLHSVNEYSVEDINRPALQENEVLVKVKAVGICGSDIPRIYETGAHVHPLIPGHEFAGEVVDSGSLGNNSWIGKSVGIFPLIPCMKCESCVKKQYELCRNYNYLGSRRDGGFAEYVAVPVKNLIELPDNVDYQEAAMLEPMAVATHAMRRVKISSNEGIVVCGLGTIGLLLVMMLVEAGYKKIYVIGNKEFQKNRVIEMGIQEHHYCDLKSENVLGWLNSISDGVGTFFECVGKNESIHWAVDAVKPEGYVCLVGNPYGDIQFEKATYWKILRNQIHVTGSWNSSFTNENMDDWHYVLERLEQKRIQPSRIISHTYDLNHIEEGLLLMKEKKEEYGKIMITI